MKTELKRILALSAVAAIASALPAMAGLTIVGATVTLTGQGWRHIVNEGDSEPYPEYTYRAENLVTFCEGKQGVEDPEIEWHIAYTWTYGNAILVDGGRDPGDGEGQDGDSGATIHGDDFVTIRFEPGMDDDITVTVYVDITSNIGDASTSDSMEVVVPMVDLNGWEPDSETGALTLVPEDEEEEPGVFLEYGVTKVVVEDLHVEEGEFHLTFDGTKIKLNGDDSGLITIECWDPTVTFPQEFVVTQGSGMHMAETGIVVAQVDLSHTNRTDTDRVVVQTMEVELAINNTRDAGDDIVCRYSSNPDGRPTVPCRARVRGLGAGILTVTLANRAGDGDVRFPGAEDTTKTLELPAVGTLPGLGPWVPFVVSGEVASNSMRDAIIEARLGGAGGVVCGKRGATVLWGELDSPDVAELFAPLVYEDRAHFLAEYGTTSTGVSLAAGLFAMSVIQIRGCISPPNFDVGPIPDPVAGYYDVANMTAKVDRGFVMKRRIVAVRRYLDGTEQAPSLDNEPDDSNFDYQDVTPHPGDPGKLVVVDVDAPQSGLVWDENQDRRMRGNFEEWLVFTYEVDGTRQEVRCSDNYPWGCRSRLQRVGDVRSLWLLDVDGDGVDDPGDDFPNDGEGENEVVKGIHTTLEP